MPLGSRSLTCVLPSMSGDEVVLGTLARKNQPAQIKISFGHRHLGTVSNLPLQA
jgi:hypothetical protein